MGNPVEFVLFMGTMTALLAVVVAVAASAVAAEVVARWALRVFIAECFVGAAWMSLVAIFIILGR